MKKKIRNKIEKPSPEAKALSLFLMAFKKTSPLHKEKSKRINKLWNLVVENKLHSFNYDKEVESMLLSFGGYDVVLEKTVRFYIETTGEWTLKGEDKYCLDARNMVTKISNEET